LLSQKVDYGWDISVWQLGYVALPVVGRGFIDPDLLDERFLKQAEIQAPDANMIA
jgi:hypothetical protein